MKDSRHADGGFDCEQRMSNFSRYAYHPASDTFREAMFYDDHFGRHEYGAKFAGDPTYYRMDEITPPEGKVFTLNQNCSGGSETEYGMRIWSILVAPRGELEMGEERSTLVSLADGGGGEYITLENSSGSVDLDLEEWSHVVRAVESLLRPSPDGATITKTTGEDT